MARADALAARPVQVDDDVAQLDAGAAGAAQHVAVVHDAAADAGAERQGDGVVGAAGSAVDVLGEAGAVAVVVELHGQAEELLQAVVDAARRRTAG